MGGHDHCAVYDCNHRHDKDNNVCSFYTFPKQINLKSQWIQASGRKDLKNVEYAKICGCHFVSGKPDRRNRESVDAVPSLNIPKFNSTTKKQRLTNTSSKSRDWLGAVQQGKKEDITTTSVPKRSKRHLAFTEVPSIGNDIEISEIMTTEQSQRSIASDLLLEESFCFDDDHNYASRNEINFTSVSIDTQTEYATSTDDSTQTSASDSDYLKVKVKQYEHLISELQSKLKAKEQKDPAFGHNMMKDDKSAMFWTGLPKKEVFLCLFQYLEPKAKNLKYSRNKTADANKTSKAYNRKPGTEPVVPLIEQFFAVLVRLKVGLLVTDISQRMGISKGLFSLIFEKWIRFLRDELEDITRFPTLAEIKKYMPEQFLKYNNTRVIIDCTEIHCQKPSALKSQRQLWSNYKHHNTYKGLVGISPDGTVVYISNLYGGSCSDKYITKDCGILKHLQPGDCVMADRGFQIDDILPSGVNLNLPPFVDSKLGQLTPKQVEETRRIASTRIHVERAIQRIKLFHILDGVMPLSLHYVVEDIFKVCSYLTNFQSPIIA